MPVRSDAVGRVIEPVHLDVTARLTQAYAAGLGDVSARYLDDAAPGGVIAPPAFCVSVEWPAFLELGRLDLGVTRAERLRGVHAFQDSTFRRPIRPGDRLRTHAEIVEVRATRAGALTVVRLETQDDADGAPVVTSFYGSLYRGVAVDGADASIAPVPAFPPHAGTATEVEKCEIRVAREAAHVYTECARIWNPIHTERRVALEAGLPDIILHGTATWALAAREIVNRFAGGDPTRLRRLAGQFRAPVIPGTAIVFEGGRAGAQVQFEVRNAEGEPAIAGGRALLADGGAP
jgi:acyl dehydratase